MSWNLREETDVCSWGGRGGEWSLSGIEEVSVKRRKKSGEQ